MLGVSCQSRGRCRVLVSRQVHEDVHSYPMGTRATASLVRWAKAGRESKLCAGLNWPGWMGRAGRGKVGDPDRSA